MAKAKKAAITKPKKMITAKQRVARKKNIEIARRSKKKGGGERAKESIKIGMALSAAKMNMKTASIRISELSYQQSKRKRPSKVLARKIDKLAKEYDSDAAFIKKYSGRKTR